MWVPYSFKKGHPHYHQGRIQILVDFWFRNHQFKKKHRLAATFLYFVSFRKCLSGELTRSVHLQFSLPFFRIGLLNFGNPAPGGTLDLIFMVSFGFFHACQAWFASCWCFPETMNPTGSRKPYAPKNENFLGDEELWEIGQVMWWKASETKKETSSGQKKTYLAGVHLLVYRGWICRHSDCDG